MRYISLPVLAKGVWGPVGLTLGPQFAVLVSANDTVTQKQGSATVKIQESVEGALRRFDFGIAAGAEYSCRADRGMRSLRVRARGYLGLVDTVTSDATDAVRNWNFSIGLDIPIGGPSKHADPKAGAASGTSGQKLNGDAFREPRELYHASVPPQLRALCREHEGARPVGLEHRGTVHSRDL
jgi:hypothetical protein